MFTDNILKELIKYCEAEYPEEACGLVVGAKGKPESDRVAPCKNISGQKYSFSGEKIPDIRTRRFAMDPNELIHILEGMRANGEVLKAIYHSHPDCDASFSELDHKYSLNYSSKKGDKPEPLYKNISYIIVSVIRGHFSEIKTYKWNPQINRFKENNLTI